MTTIARKAAEEILNSAYTAVEATIIIQRAIDASHEWQPIETAPKDGTWVQIYWPTMPVSWSFMAAFNCDDGCGWLMPANMDYGEVFPTHWKRINNPAPPKGDAA